MRKRLLCLLMTAVVLALAAGCGDKDEPEIPSSIVEKIPEDEIRPRKEQAAPVAEEEPEEEVPAAQQPKEVPEGMYLSELTGEPISEELKDQRPVAVMVDNESIALPHYGTAEADVVYEMMNSTANDRITRLMCLVKDWGAIKQLGSIRSTRPTNIILASEWNAVLCHDGGPYHNDHYFAQSWARDHFSGTFSRVENGKAREFTEYIVTGDLDRNFNNSGVSRTYNQFANEGSHFNFAPWGITIDLGDVYGDVVPATKVSLPFKHNGSKLSYNESTGSYEYIEYGDVHKDAEDGEPLAFTNVLLQCAGFQQLDQNGYLIYDCIASVQPAWYLTGGKGVLLYWSKTSETGVTRFYDMDGNEVQINTGKTYIGLIPSDSWSSVSIE